MRIFFWLMCCLFFTEGDLALAKENLGSYVEASTNCEIKFSNDEKLKIDVEIPAEDRCDLIVFSYNRPMQLYALLESLEKLAKNIHKIAVLARVDRSYEAGYQIVVQRYPYVHYIRQSETNPRSDFKPLVMDLLFGAFGDDARYVMFAVDDIIVTDDFDVSEGIRKLQQTGAYGLYYRLGRHIDYSWIINRYQGIPPLNEEGDGYFSWQFKTGVAEWAYPNTVDMTMYRKDEIENAFQLLDFTYPNDLEGYWASIRNLEGKGICCHRAKIINIPANAVQTGTCNRIATHPHSSQELNRLFLNGYKIDTDHFYRIVNNSVHVDYALKFVLRSRA